MTTFQIILTAIFGVCIVGALVVVGMSRGSSGEVLRVFGKERMHLVEELVGDGDKQMRVKHLLGVYNKEVVVPTVDEFVAVHGTKGCVLFGNGDPMPVNSDIKDSGY
jgi:hypothetical protein